MEDEDVEWEDVDDDEYENRRMTFRRQFPVWASDSVHKSLSGRASRSVVSQRASAQHESGKLVDEVLQECTMTRQSSKVHGVDYNTC